MSVVGYWYYNGSGVSVCDTSGCGVWLYEYDDKVDLDSSSGWVFFHGFFMECFSFDFLSKKIWINGTWLTLNMLRGSSS